MFFIVWSFSLLLAAAFAGGTAAIVGLNYFVKKMAELIGADRTWQRISWIEKKSTTPSNV